MFLERAMQSFVLRVVQPEVEDTPSRPYACDDVRQRMRVGDPSPHRAILKSNVSSRKVTDFPAGVIRFHSKNSQRHPSGWQLLKDTYTVCRLAPGRHRVQY